MNTREKGDKVKINGVIREIENITQWDKDTQRYKFVGVSGWYEIKEEQHQSKNVKNSGCMRRRRKTIKNKEWLKEKVNNRLSRAKEETNSDPFAYSVGRVDAYKRVLQYIDQLDEPQKVIIPQFVADWIEGCKKDNTPLSLAYDVAAFGGVAEWLYEQENADNIDLFAKAWIDGYEIEKEPQYGVKLPTGKVVEAFDTNAVSGRSGALSPLFVEVLSSTVVKLPTPDKPLADAVALIAGGEVYEVTE